MRRKINRVDLGFMHSEALRVFPEMGIGWDTARLSSSSA
jgi:hypothetical protein